MKGQRGLLRLRMTRMGPNDTSDVVWAIGKKKKNLLFFYYLLLYLGTMYVIKVQSSIWKAMMTITVPNNVPGVFWALHGYFCFFLCIFKY